MRAFSKVRPSLVACAIAASALVSHSPVFAQPAPSAGANRNDAYRQGVALLQQGEINGDVALLNRAANIFRQNALALTPQKDKAANWADIQGKLGRALLCIGALTQSQPHYEQAASAYRAALGVKTRSASPQDWASLQNGLGGALLGMGKMTGLTAHLQLAESAFRSALDVYSKEETPVQWADARTNLGITHFMLGDLTGDKKYYSAALEELASAQPLLARSAANSVAAILKQIERRIGES